MRWSWRGFVASILALALAIGFAAAMVGATVQHEPISQQGAALLTTLGGALIGAVAGWLGGANAEQFIARRDQDMSQETQEPEPQPDPDKTPGATPRQDQDAAPVDDGLHDAEPIETEEP